MALDDNVMYQGTHFIGKSVLPPRAGVPATRDPYSSPGKPRMPGTRTRQIKLTADLAAEHRDLSLVLETCTALRLVPQDDLENWLNGAPCPASRVQHPNPSKVKFIKQSATGVEKEFEVEAGGRVYTITVHPNREPYSDPSNTVWISYGIRHPEGPNRSRNYSLTNVDKDPVHFLSLAESPSLQHISFKDVVDFYDKGFKTFETEVGEQKRERDYRDGDFAILNPFASNLFDMERFTVSPVDEPGYKGVELKIKLKVPERNK